MGVERATRQPRDFDRITQEPKLPHRMRFDFSKFPQQAAIFWRCAQYRLPLLRDRYLRTPQGSIRLRVLAPLAALAILMVGPGLTSSQALLASVEARTAQSFAALLQGAASLGTQELAAIDPAAGTMAPPVPEKPKTPYLQTASYKVSSGDTLSDVLERAEVPSGDRYKIAEELAKAGFNPKALKPGQDLKVEAVIHPTGEKTFKGMNFRVSPFQHYEVASFSGALVAKAIDTPMQDVVVSHSLPIKGSVYESMRGAGVPRQLIGNFLKPFAHFVDFQRDIRAGRKNRVEVLYDGQQTVDGAATLPGNIIYAALMMGERRVALYRFKTQDGDEEFFTEDGKSGKRLLMKTPIDGARLSSGFGMRKHPVLGYSKMHKGVDFAAPTGTPIYAAGDGTVEKAGPFSSYGNYIKIRHAGGYKTAYAHLSRYAKGMRSGKRVKQGEIIGYVGTTGRSTGPHLHYEILASDRPVNPSGIKMTGGVELAGAELKKFKAEVVRINALFKKSQMRPVAQVQNVSF